MNLFGLSFVLYALRCLWSCIKLTVSLQKCQIWTDFLTDPYSLLVFPSFKVMICCVTKKYICLSEICQREVTLADALRKPIIPLLLEELDWPPEGQLALIFAKLLYINMVPGLEPLRSSRFNEILQKTQWHVSH